MHHHRVAVLVDGDNISPSHSGSILAAAAPLGRLDVTRVYGAADRPSGWLAAPGYRLIHAGAGKNAADLLLSIDAMELALAGGMDGFVIASSDGDFTHLAQRLRERGHMVLGLGETKAPPTFRAACTSFVLLDGDPPAQVAGDLDRKVRTMIATHSRNGCGMRIAELGSKMHAVHDVSIGQHPDRSWRAYLSRRPTLYDLDPEGPGAMVRFLPKGFATTRN